MSWCSQRNFYSFISHGLGNTKNITQSILGLNSRRYLPHTLSPFTCSSLTPPLRSMLSSTSSMEPFMTSSDSSDPCPCEWHPQLEPNHRIPVVTLSSSCVPWKGRLARWVRDSSLSHAAVGKLLLFIYLYTSEDSKAAPVRGFRWGSIKSA